MCVSYIFGSPQKKAHEQQRYWIEMGRAIPGRTIKFRPFIQTYIYIHSFAHLNSCYLCCELEIRINCACISFVAAFLFSRMCLFNLNEYAYGMCTWADRRIRSTLAHGRIKNQNRWHFVKPMLVWQRVKKNQSVHDHNDNNNKLRMWWWWSSPKIRFEIKPKFIDTPINEHQFRTIDTHAMATHQGTSMTILYIYMYIAFLMSKKKLLWSLQKHV